MKTHLNTAILVIALLSFGCGKTPETEARQTNQNSVNNAVAAPPGSTTAATPVNTTEKPLAGGFVPVARPIEKGKTHTVGGIIVTIPADWKKLDQNERWAKFESPEKIMLYVSRDYYQQESDMLRKFTKMRLEKPDDRIMMRAVDNELGILQVEENNPTFKADRLGWETFPPPDANGYAVKRSVTLTCPLGTYEQNKQIMFDVLAATKFKK
jgi:hypothetical protein